MWIQIYLFILFPVTLFGQVPFLFQTMHDPHCHNDPNHTDHSVHLFCAKVITKNCWNFTGSEKVHGFTSFYHGHLHVLLTSRWKPILQEDIATAETRLGGWLKYLHPVKWVGPNRGQKCEEGSWPRPSSWLHPEQATWQGWVSKKSKTAAGSIASFYFFNFRNQQVWNVPGWGPGLSGICARVFLRRL